MRTFTLTTLAALAALLVAAPAPASAQEVDGQVRVAPEGEGFVAEMPTQPATRDVRIDAGKLKVAGRAYVSTGKGEATYTVFALDDPNKVGAGLSDKGEGGLSAYLDEIAEVAWEALVRPEYERLKAERATDFTPGMDYRREFELAGLPAREYRLNLPKGGGPVYVCADGPRVYVVAGYGPAVEWPRLTRFVESFSPKSSAPARAAETTTGVGSGVGPGHTAGTDGGAKPEAAGAVDYTRFFSPKDVTQKAVILAKPDPGFTESARKFSVTGVVRLRAVLNRTGEVTNLAVIKGLPHGLTERTINAARGIKFRPARKDGRDVSQYVTFEYNFNIY